MRPRNQRLPTEAYCDPTRFTFFTVRATEDTSPFAKVVADSAGIATVHPNVPLCEAVLTCLHEARNKYGCDVAVGCLMPDHIHILARPRTTAANVLTLVDRFKGKSTHQSWAFGIEGRLWPPRSFDHVLWPDESPMELAEYISNNPVRKRYVKRWQDWPFTRVWDPLE